MKVCTSFWSYPSISIIKKVLNNEFLHKHENILILLQKTEELLKLYEISFNSFKRIYSDIYLFTDSFGAFLLKKYTNIDNRSIKILFDNLPIKHYRLWNLGKMISYKEVSKIGDPVLFFDLDLIIDEALPKDFTENALFCYDDICKKDVKNWDNESYINYIKNNLSKSNNKEIDSKIEYFNKSMSIDGSFEENEIDGRITSTPIPNCCIFGGSRPDIIYNIYNNILINILSKDNEEYWLNDGCSSYQKPCISEQLILGLYAMSIKENNEDLKSNYLYNDKSTILNFSNFYHNKKMTKIKHFGWHKRSIVMNKKIEEIIKDLKYWE